MPATCDPSCGCHCGPNAEQGKWYGVHSYLHLFYEDCARASPDGDRGPAAPPACTGWNSVLWKVTLSAGGFLLLLGAAALATGFFLTPRLEGVGAGEFMVLDQEAVEYNHALRTCQAVGMALCAVAGALLVTYALSSALAGVDRGRERGGEAEEEPQSAFLPENPPGKGSLVGAEYPAQGGGESPAGSFGESLSAAPSWQLSSDLDSGH